MYGDQHPEGTLDDDTLVFHLDVDSHAFSGRCQVCAIWILSTSREQGSRAKGSDQGRVHLLIELGKNLH